MRLFVGVLALAVAASTQAMAFGRQRDARMIKKRKLIKDVRVVISAALVAIAS